MYSVELKIKRLSLAAELRIIRTEIKRQKKYKKNQSWLLQSHADGVVRPAVRYANLAHTFLRGRPYRTAENKCRRMPNIEELAKAIKPFSYGMAPHSKDEALKAVDNWLSGN